MRCPTGGKHTASTWKTTSRGMAGVGARAEATPSSHGSRATTARAPTTARAAATSSAMHPSQAAVAACEGKHLPGSNGSPHLAPRTTVLCARGVRTALVRRRNHAAVDRHARSSVGAFKALNAPSVAPRDPNWPSTTAHSNQWAISRNMVLNNGPFLDAAGLASPAWGKPRGAVGGRAGITLPCRASM